MELDDLKLAWLTLDKQLQQSNALSLQLFRDRTLDKARSHLRPLWWGQVVQMCFGLLLMLLAVSSWTANRDVLPVLIGGITMHAYSILLIVMGGATLGLIHKLDYAAPVLTIQKQLAQLRRFYVINGMVTGLPWWLLWMPFLMMLAGLGGNASGVSWALSWLSIGSGIGIAGLLGTWWFHRWSRHPGRPVLARKMEDSVSGNSLRKARDRLDEIARFEQE